ncbi:hypothetical protein CSKR_108426 [Clonorchis sinensis]|uniref:Uncharacterized protein n=1 Tax=Clonorchis sinensis TaxID=79923 RepID=A0A419PV16_CLOSI|nr:hypothetical protein CSKR_108426 [Clonorchis sinensis]
MFVDYLKAKSADIPSMSTGLCKLSRTNKDSDFVTGLREIKHEIALYRILAFFKNKNIIYRISYANSTQWNLSLTCVCFILPRFSKRDNFSQRSSSQHFFLWSSASIKYNILRKQHELSSGDAVVTPVDDCLLQPCTTSLWTIQRLELPCNQEKHKGWDTVRLPKLRQGKSRGTGRIQLLVSKFAL